jgi:dTDP-glucose 4,6-dehydratase
MRAERTPRSAQADRQEGDVTAAARRWDGVDVLVTGAGGFIGSHLAEALVRAGANVRAFVRYNSRNDFGRLEECDQAVLDAIEVFTGDLGNPEAVAGGVAGCDIVMHLGALIPIPYSYRHPREYVTVNVEGTINVLEAARRLGVRRLVHTSTSEVYGTARIVPIPEEHVLQPQSPYAASKLSADHLALSYARSFETPVTVVRPFNTFGPRQSARAVIPTIIAQALTRDVVELGSLNPTRDLTFVSDTVEGMILAATADGVDGEVVNLGTGHEWSIAELADHILRLIRVELPVLSVEERQRPPQSEVERLVADSSKAERLLGWRPEVELEDGLLRTIEWMRGAIGRFKPAIYNV